MKKRMLFFLIVASSLCLASSPAKVEFCSKEKTATAVAKVVLAQHFGSNVEGPRISYKVKQRGPSWSIIWTDAESLDGRIRIDIDRQDCGVRQFYPQYDGN